MMDNDILIKLAEIAGHNPLMGVDGFVHAEYFHPDGYRIKTPIWQPHKDIAQAFEVLEGWRSKDDLRHYMISSPKQHSCIKFYDLDLYCYDSDGFIYTVKGEHEVLSEAICQAVLKASKDGEQR